MNKSFIIKIFIICLVTINSNAIEKVVLFGDSLMAGYGLEKKDHLSTILEIELTKKGFEIIVCLDGDTAGRNASIRLMNNLLSSENFELGIKFVLLPKNYDPDLLLDSNLKEQLNKIHKYWFLQID